MYNLHTFNEIMQQILFAFVRYVLIQDLNPGIDCLFNVGVSVPMEGHGQLWVTTKAKLQLIQ